MSNKVMRLVSMLAVLLVAVQVTQAQVITAVAHRNTDSDATEDPQIAADPLDEGSLFFVDRTHVYAEVPDLVIGAECVLLANDNKNNGSYELDITLAGNAIVYVFVDNRMGGAAGGLDVAPNIDGMPWLTDMGFVDTGIDLGIDESADGSINQYLSIFALEVNAGVVTIGGCTEGNAGNMIGVAVLPAPVRETASNPVPMDAATDVLRDAALAWTPGENATSHDVYLGTVRADVEAATRNDPLDVLVAQGQPDASYDAGILELGETYYWRVDEIAGAETFVGAVWSFTVEPVAITIEGVIATTNVISTAGQTPDNVVSGLGLTENGEHGIESTTMWTAKVDANDPNTPYIQFEFDRVYKMHEMQVWNHNLSFEFVLGIGLKDITVEYSVDGLDWMVLGDVELPQAPGTITYTGSPVALDGIGAKFIRLAINSHYGTGNDIGLSEVRFSYIPAFAREPKPATDATDVDVSATLSWRAGRDAASYEVYMGADAETLEMVATTAGTSYSPDFAYGATYAWMVVAVNGAEAWDSDVWTLTTEAYEIVDDFESYDDDMDGGTTVWHAWADGYEDIANGGSAVGHDPSPFCELENVHGGAQAMPVYYSTALSEIKFTVAPAQDWTAQGLKSLAFWFYGDPANTGQLYVKINGVKVSYPGDPGDIAKTAWLPFNVDLTAINGAQSVSTLTIGMENATTEGLLLIDDVRLYPLVSELVVPVEPDAGALLAHYEFEGNANDSSGNGLNGTLSNAQVVATGAPGMGMGLQVNDSGYMDIGNPPSLDFATEDWAVSAWFSTQMSGTGDANKGCIVGKGGDTGGGHRWCLIMSEATEGVVSLICDDDATKIECHSTSVTNDGEWHAVVGQRVGRTAEIYIDGVLETVATNVPENYDLSGTVQHNAYVGVITDHDPDTLFKTYDGLVDDVRIYHQSLTAGEILWLNGETEPRPKSF